MLRLCLFERLSMEQIEQVLAIPAEPEADADL